LPQEEQIQRQREEFAYMSKSLGGDTLLPLGRVLEFDVARRDVPPFREMVEAVPAAIYTTDAEGRITYFNEAAAELWGCRPEIGISEYCGSWKLLRPDGSPLPHDECPMAVALKERRPVRGIDAVAVRPDGTRVPFMAYPTPLLRADGELSGAVNMLPSSARLLMASSRAGTAAPNGCSATWRKR
jgi:PAS domain S-box-containing protein